MLICDTHADTLYAMQQKEAAKTDVTMARLLCPPHTRVQALALFVGSKGLSGDDHDLVQRELRSLETLKELGWNQIRHISDAVPGMANVMLTIEGGEAFGSTISAVKKFAELGVRAASLVWNNDNLLAYPACKGSTESLTPLGLDMVKALHSHHIALDISHLNERGSWELLESDVAPMASHSCAMTLCSHPRNLTDAQIKALIRANGYIGINFYPIFLTGSNHADIDDIIDHIEFICDMGGESIVGLGSDFDGIDCYPKGLRHPGQILSLFQRMEARGFTSGLIQQIAGENFARYMDMIDAAPQVRETT